MNIKDYHGWISFWMEDNSDVILPLAGIQRLLDFAISFFLDLNVSSEISKTRS